ncbi:MAG: hypothetical protein NT144_06790 [Bacteroidia bacterium]|nr:hypothetical protein [Bacteroidia bacterium]
MPYPSGNVQQGLNDTSSRKFRLGGTKGQPEGSALTGKIRKPWVAEMGLVSKDTAGQNNSNLTSLTALVVNGEWELILANSSHYCFILYHPAHFYPVSATHVGLLNIFAYCFNIGNGLFRTNRFHCCTGEKR